MTTYRLNAVSTLAGWLIFGAAFLLQVLFLVLKLGGVIAWPWIWVLAPLWGYVLLMGALIVLGMGLLFTAYILSRRSLARKK